MTAIESIHAAHGATFGERGGRRIVEEYGRPERAHRAVRNGVGWIERARGVVVVEGDDRVEYVDNVVSNRVPTGDGAGAYALVLDPQGRIETEMVVYNAGDRLLCLMPPERAEPLATDWAEKIFIQDVTVRDASDEFAIFGVHGPLATEKVASVLAGPGTPETPFSFVRGGIGEAGVTVARTDAPTGEEGYAVICRVEAAATVAEALGTGGMATTPFGYRTLESLTLEAGTPLFETELEGRIPNLLGLRSALDFEKGCYVGQEVVSRVENRGRPSQRLTGLALEEGNGVENDEASVTDDGSVVANEATTGSTDGSDDPVESERDRPAVPTVGAAVFDGDASVGEVTRAAWSPLLERPIALGLVDYDSEATDLTVRVEGEEVPAERRELPFVEGSERSGRLPAYP